MVTALQPPFARFNIPVFRCFNNAYYTAGTSAVASFVPVYLSTGELPGGPSTIRHGKVKLRRFSAVRPCIHVSTQAPSWESFLLMQYLGSFASRRLQWQQ